MRLGRRRPPLTETPSRPLQQRAAHPSRNDRGCVPALRCGTGAWGYGRSATESTPPTLHRGRLPTSSAEPLARPTRGTLIRQMIRCTRPACHEHPTRRPRRTQPNQVESPDRCLEGRPVARRGRPVGKNTFDCLSSAWSWQRTRADHIQDA